MMSDAEIATAINEAKKVDKEILGTPHPAVTLLHDQWDFYCDAYEGGLEWRSGNHLWRYPRETWGNYALRLQRAYYANYVADVIDIPLGHLFKRGIVRTLGHDDNPSPASSEAIEYQAFINDVDGRGTTLDQLSRHAMTIAEQCGFCMVLLDMPSADSPILSLADQKRNKLFPYATVIHPLNLVNWSQGGEYHPLNWTGDNRGVDVYGGNNGPLVSVGNFGTYGLYAVQRAEGNQDPYGFVPGRSFYKPHWIRYREPADEDQGAYGKPTDSKFNYRTWTRDYWTLHDDNGNLVKWGKNAMGDEIPLAIYYYKKSTRFPLVGISAVSDIAPINKEIYNLDSQIGEIINRCTFPMLSQPDDSSSEADEMQLGTAILWTFPANARHSPAYIAPPSAPIEIIQAKRADLVREIFRLAKLSSVVSNEKRVAESGLKSAYDFEETNQALADLAANGEAGEFEISRMWWKYVAPNADKVTITTRWPKKFDILSLNDEIAQSVSLTMLNMPPMWWKLTKKSIAEKTLQRTSASNPEIMAALDEVMKQADTTMQPVQNTDVKTIQNIDRPIMNKNAGTSPAGQ